MCSVNKFCTTSNKVYAKIRNGRAILLVLLWLFTAFISYEELGYEWVLTFNSYEGLVVLFVPIAGYIGDVYLGRFRVIKYCMRVLWVVLITCDFIIAFGNPAPMLQVIASVGAVASVGMLANIIQFGIDQLTDASSDQVSAFIQWIVWIVFLAESVFLLSTSCFCGLYSDSIPLFFQPLMCTISILSDCFCGHWLIKEPVKHNPLRLIFQVLRYALKNKYPRLRSAFTYWEDKPYSRIDLGKSKYGGPFTTEQVEDVKTFFRILGLLAATIPVMCLVIGILLLDINNLYIQFRNNHSNVGCSNSKSPIEYIKYCLNVTTVQFSPSFFLVVAFPVAKFFLHPLLKKFSFLVNVGIFHRMLLGLCALLTFECSILIIEVASLHLTPEYNNITCILNVPKGLPPNELLNLNMNWLIIPQALLGTSMFLMLSSTVEFIYAQAPMSMRGFLFGIIVLELGVSYGVANLFSQMIPKVAKKYVKNSSEGRSCNIWYFGVLIFMTLLLICGGILVKKVYKPRRRDEDLHNTQKFAVEYFDKYHPYDATTN